MKIAGTGRSRSTPVKIVGTVRRAATASNNCWNRPAAELQPPTQKLQPLDRNSNATGNVGAVTGDGEVTGQVLESAPTGAATNASCAGPDET